jgi:uncharacterized protein YggE
LRADSPVYREALVAAVHEAQRRAQAYARAREVPDLEPATQIAHARVRAWFTMTQPPSLAPPAG